MMPRFSSLATKESGQSILYVLQLESKSERLWCLERYKITPSILTLNEEIHFAGSECPNSFDNVVALCYNPQAIEIVNFFCCGGKGRISDTFDRQAVLWHG